MTGTSERSLRRNLGLRGAIAISIAAMAPAMAVNINPQGTVGLVGRAVPTTFLLATVGALLISHSFVRLTRRFQTAGSVYAFTGRTLGPTAGVVSGWMLAAAYTGFVLVTVLAAGRFATGELRSLGLWERAPDWFGFVLAIAALLVALLLATRPIEGAGRVALIVEAITVALITLVTVVVAVRLVMHHTPGNQTFSLRVFVPEHGTSLSSLALGTVFGFLSFAGFEAAAVLGEESVRPERDVPRAVFGTVVFGGVFYVAVTAIQVMGFGTDDAGLQAYEQSPALMSGLARTYIASWLGHVIEIGAAFSAVSCAVAATVGAARLVFALSRHGAGPQSLGRVSTRTHAPARASIAVAIAASLLGAVGWIASRGNPFTVFLVAGTAGTLVILVTYVLAVAGALRMTIAERAKASLMLALDIVIPVLALVTLGYTLWRSLVPLPHGSMLWGPGAFIAVTVVTVALVVARPGIARAAGKALTDDEVSPGGVS